MCVLAGGWVCTCTHGVGVCVAVLIGCVCVHAHMACARVRAPMTYMCVHAPVACVCTMLWLILHTLGSLSNNCSIIRWR